MKFSDEDYAYLEGKKFSNGYRLKLGNNPQVGRLTKLVEICKGKNVLHIGCCDHKPLIMDKIKNHTWLHGLLEENCNEVIGVDINKEAVDFVNENHLSKKNVFCADITSSDFAEKLPSVKIDYVLMGEILEHVDNPVAFLQMLKSNMSKYQNRGGGAV